MLPSAERMLRWRPDWLRLSASAAFHGKSEFVYFDCKTSTIFAGNFLVQHETDQLAIDTPESIRCTTGRLLGRCVGTYKLSARSIVDALNSFWCNVILKVSCRSCSV